MAETYTPSGNQGTALQRFTSGEATGTFGSMDRSNITIIADKIRRMDDSGNVRYLNDDANAGNTLGFTINQGANDDEILSFKSSDIAHGVTDNAETDTYGFFKKVNAAEGGLLAVGLSESTRGIDLYGIHVTDDTTKSTAANAAAMIRGDLKSGTGAVTVGANANILAIRTGSTVRFIFDQEGDFHADSSSTTF